MKFSTDHYFQIGHAHYTAGKPCQDHSLSRSNGSVACAIVSDGCSSGGNTDVGARILTLGTLQAIRDHAKARDGSLATAEVSITARQQQIIGTARPILGLEPTDMLATCAYAYCTQEGALVRLHGDGVIAWKYRDGAISMRRYEWADNAPFYQSYEGADLESFVGHHGGDIRAVRFTEEIFLRRTNGDLIAEDSKSYTLKEGITGISITISRADLEQMEFLGVFTDGVAQIDGVDWRDAVTEFLAFKNSPGEFAKRRIIRGIKDMERKGSKGPIDDISYAVIHIQPEAETEESSWDSQLQEAPSVLSSTDAVR
jgi:hypothetical protein